MTDTKKRNCTRRTLHYFLNATRKNFGLAIGGVVTTPMVIFLRNILTPLLLADMIQTVSDGLQGEELYQLAIKGDNSFREESCMGVTD